MEYIDAALLLHHLKKEINEDHIKKVLIAAGSTVDDTKVKALVSALSGVDIDKELKEAQMMPVAAPSVQKEAKVEKKEEVKDKEEEKKREEQAAAGLGSLFG